jgi:MFS family permease
LPLELQVVRGYSPLAAGSALLPMTAILLLLSSTSGRVAQRIGPRAPMTLGPLVAAAGLVLLARSDAAGSWARAVLPGVAVLGLGLALTVAPLTATVLAAAPPEKAGLASAINNAVARTGSLLSVALLPALVGIRGNTDAAHIAAGFPRAMYFAAGGCVCGALIALFRMRAPEGFERTRTKAACPLDAPTLRGWEPASTT